MSNLQVVRTQSSPLSAPTGLATPRQPSPLGPALSAEPATSRGVTVATKPGETVESVRTRGFEKMAEQAGLSMPARAEFVRRAAQLDDGGLNAPAASPSAEARQRLAAQSRSAIDTGSVTVAPTQAQAGLLKLLQAKDAQPLSEPEQRLSSWTPSGAAAGWLLPMPRNEFAGEPGRAGVTPQVAQSILHNVAEGRAPFKPELGEVGRVSWFTTQSNPYVGPTGGKSVTLPVEVANTSGQPTLEFGEKQLLEIFNRNTTAANTLAEEQFRKESGKINGEPLTNNEQKQVTRRAGRIAERAMWTEVGETVRASESGIGKVKLENSVFSKSGNGEFTLTSRPENVRLPKGAAAKLVEVINTQAKPAEAGVLEAAEKLAAQEKWGGRVQGAFRVGGRVLIVVGVAADTWRIITATDKVKTSVEVAGGWTGATLMGGAFATWYAPADVAGPWAWLGHGVGTLAAGAVGYLGGSYVTKVGYELTVEGKPLDVVF